MTTDCETNGGAAIARHDNAAPD